MSLLHRAALATTTLSLGALSLPALAQDAIIEVGEEIELLNASGLRLEGNWARVYPAHDSDGWVVFITGGNTYNIMEAEADFTITSDKIRLVADWPERLVDHMITQCPDGTWFHVASANLDRPNDSAYVFRYDQDYSMICSGTVAERDLEFSYNDAPLVCTDGATVSNPMDGTVTHTETEAVQAPFVFFDENCEQTHTELHPTFPPASGATIIHDDIGNYFWEVRTSPDDFTLLFQLYGPWMEPVEESVVVDTLVPEDQTTRWPQGGLMVGDLYFVAHLARQPGVLYSSDTGDLWLQVFDRDLNHLQAVQLAEFGDSEGAQRPWITRRDDQLLITYTEYEGANFNPTVVPVTIDLDVVGLGDDGGDGSDGTDGGDGSDGADGADGSDGADGTDGTSTDGTSDGSDDGSSNGGDDGTTTPPDEKGGCATGALPASGALALLALGAVGRRRR